MSVDVPSIRLVDPVIIGTHGRHPDRDVEVWGHLLKQRVHMKSIVVLLFGRTHKAASGRLLALRG